MSVSQCVYPSLNARCVNRSWVRIFDADEFKSYTNDRTLTTSQYFLTCKDTTVWQAHDAWVHPDEDWPALVGSRCDMGIQKRHSAARHYYIRAMLLKLIEQLASQGNHTDHIGSQCHFTNSLAQCRLRLQFPTSISPSYLSSYSPRVQRQPEPSNMSHYPQDVASGLSSTFDTGTMSHHHRSKDDSQELNTLHWIIFGGMFANFSLIVILLVRGMVHNVLSYAEVDLEAGNSHPFIDLRELGLLTSEEDMQDPPPKYEHIEALLPAYDQVVVLQRVLWLSKWT
jgi:hypothetical protein